MNDIIYYITKDLVNLILGYIGGDIPDDGTDFLEEHMSILSKHKMVGNQSLPIWFFNKHLKDENYANTTVEYRKGISLEFWDKNAQQVNFWSIPKDTIFPDWFIEKHASKIICSESDNFYISESIILKHYNIFDCQHISHITLEMLDKFNIEYDYFMLSSNKSVSFEYIDNNIEQEWDFDVLSYRTDIPVWFIVKYENRFNEAHAFNTVGINKNNFHDSLINMLLADNLIRFNDLSFITLLSLKDKVKQDVYWHNVIRNKNCPFEYIDQNYETIKSTLGTHNKYPIYSHPDIAVDFIEKYKNTMHQYDKLQISKNSSIPLSYFKNNIKSMNLNYLSQNEGITTLEGRKKLIKDKLYSMFCAPRQN
jgi:hypothetical protein